MKELKDFAGSIAILVSSCDAFFDVWRPFAFFFRKYWGDCPFPVYLIVNQLRIRSEFIEAIAVGEDRGWASNMKLALEKIDAPRVLYLQEDYFLNGPVRAEKLAADLVYAFENDTDSFYFRARSELEPGFQSVTDRFGIVPLDSDGRSRCQLALWKRESFLSILREGESAWEMESRGSERTRNMKVLSYSTRENVPMPYLMSAVVRGLWTSEAIAMCKQANLKIEPWFRGTQSPNKFLQGLRRAQTRMRLNRALVRNRDKVIAIN